MERVVLSRRNLLTLLQKLDEKKEGLETHCQIIKGDKSHPKYPQTMDQCLVLAVEDMDYYTDRKPGSMINNRTGKLY